MAVRCQPGHRGGAGCELVKPGIRVMADFPVVSLDGPDMVNHPPHYLSHPSGVECVIVAEWFSFCLGNAIKYIWRCHEKGDPVENLKKARWYLDREISRLEAGNAR